MLKIETTLLFFSCRGYGKLGEIRAHNFNLIYL